MKTLLIILAMSTVTGLSVDAFNSLKYNTEVVAATVRGYTLGRETAIEDLQSATSAPTAELCTAWWFGTNNKAQAMTAACKNFNTQKVVAQ